jgi:hypothetical protein
MATNLISLVTQFLTPDVIARIASALGLDRTIAQKAIGAAVPALLAFLGNAVAKPGGERQLANAMAQQPLGPLDIVKNIIGGSEQKSLVERGSSMLSGLLGGSTQDALTQAVGKFAGIGEGTSKSLLGMLGPMVLGVLGQHQRDTGLDVGSLANLLASQKQQFAGAIPPGLADQMRVGGLMDTLQGGLRSGAAAASDAAGRIGRTSDAAIARASQAASAARSSPAPWLYWVLALAVLAGLAWLFFGNWAGERVAERGQPTATQPSEQGRATVGVGTANLTVDGVNLAEQANSSISALRTTLGGITDAASAQAALPKLREVTVQLDKVNALSPRLPAESRRALATLIAGAMPTINSMIDKILAIPGVGDIARPAINELRARLEPLARA